MTLILAVKDPANRRVIVCADSGAWRGDEYAVLLRQKLWRSNGWVCGLAGMTAQLEAAARLTLPPLRAKTTFEQAHEALHVEIMPELERKIADLNELNRRADPKIDDNGYSVLYSWGPWCWYVHAGSGTATMGPVEATGAAGDYALGAAHALLETDPIGGPIWVAEGTCRAVQRISRSVQAPWLWMATDGTEGRWE